MLCAVRQSGAALRCASEALRADRAVVLWAVTRDASALGCVVATPCADNEECAHRRMRGSPSTHPHETGASAAELTLAGRPRLYAGTRRSLASAQLRAEEGETILQEARPHPLLCRTAGQHPRPA